MSGWALKLRDNNYDHYSKKHLNFFQAKFEVNLTRHKKRIHEKLKTEVCHVCGKAYLDKYCLKKHVELAHPDGEQKFVCDKCGASYAALQTLRQGPLKIWTEPKSLYMYIV
jgi:hypothetical protein